MFRLIAKQQFDSGSSIQKLLIIAWFRCVKSASLRKDLENENAPINSSKYLSHACLRSEKDTVRYDTYYR